MFESLQPPGHRDGEPPDPMLSISPALRLLAAAATGLALNVPAAYAQSAAAQSAPAETVKLDQFVVTGEWGALQSSIETRRQSLRLTDSVTANDLGVLPDFNIGENLQRIPGISVDLDQAEARYVTVRGFSPNYTSTTINGSMIAATERNTRRVEMDAMPASLASSIDVTKTQTPDLEGHSVGGSIDIKGPRAIRGRPFTAKVNSKIGTYTNDEGYRGSGPSGTADVLLTRTLMQGKMGLAVSGNYYLRDSYTPQQESGSSRYWFDNAGTRVATPYGGNGYAVPVEQAPVQPADLVVLAVGIVVALLAAPHLVAHQQHRRAQRQHGDGQQVAHLALAQRQHRRVGGGAFDAAVPAAVVVVAVAVAFAVGLVVAFVVADQVRQRVVLDAEGALGVGQARHAPVDAVQHARHEHRDRRLLVELLK